MVSRALLCLQVLAILALAVDLHGTRTWGEMQLFPAEKIPDGALDPKRENVRRKIVLYHNFFRTKVRPSASNMLLMSWHNGAARQAQRYADQCVFLKHDGPKDKILPGLGTCGQNLFVSTQKTPWFFALKTWFTEYRNFTYANPNVDLDEVGHYTQMVWATTHKVGCGLASCRGGPWGHFYNYVCNYCPSGNYGKILHFPYKRGEPCNDCPLQCVSGHLCTNTCNRRDVYSNCKELVRSLDGFCSKGLCNATCECSNKLYEDYPWI